MTSFRTHHNHVVSNKYKIEMRKSGNPHETFDFLKMTSRLISKSLNTIRDAILMAKLRIEESSYYGDENNNNVISSANLLDE